MPHQKLIKLDDEMNHRLEAYRFTARFKSEAAAIRELMRLGFVVLQEKGEFAV
ncbi:MAG: hypothetical protein ACJ8AW_10475 [Rhodopila sp.]